MLACRTATKVKFPSSSSISNHLRFATEVMERHVDRPRKSHAQGHTLPSRYAKKSYHSVEHDHISNRELIRAFPSHHPAIVCLVPHNGKTIRSLLSSCRPLPYYHSALLLRCHVPWAGLPFDPHGRGLVDDPNFRWYLRLMRDTGTIASTALSQ